MDIGRSFLSLLPCLIAGLALAGFGGLSGLASDDPPDRPPGTKAALPETGDDAEGPQPRQSLQLAGLGQTQFDQCIDGVSLTTVEGELLVKLLHALRRIEVEHVERWARQSGEFGWGDLRGQSAARRGSFSALRGRVTRVSQQRPTAELAQQFNLQRFYRCECEVGAPKTPLLVYAADVPTVWELDQPLSEPVFIQGAYLKLSGGDPQQPHTPTFVVSRLAWHPDNLLGRLGLDAGLLDEAANNERLKTLGDRDGFFQLLSGAARLAPGELDAAAEQTARAAAARPGEAETPVVSIKEIIDHAQRVEEARRDLRYVEEVGELAEQVLALMNQQRQANTPLEKAAVERELDAAKVEFLDRAKVLKIPVDTPAELSDLRGWLDRQRTECRRRLRDLANSPYSQGQAMVFEGTARRAVRMRVEDPALQARFGLDHYYHLVLFVRLDRPHVVGESQMRVNDAPVIVAVRELPPGLPIGDDIHERVRAVGVLLKVLPHQSVEAEKRESTERLLAPQIIGHTVTLLPREWANSNLATWIVLGLLAVSVCGIGLWSWLTKRADAQARAKWRTRGTPP